MSNLENKAQEWNEKGNAFFIQDRYDSALECYNEALKHDSKYYKGWANKGLTLAKLQRFNESVVCFDQAILLNPKEDENLWNDKGVSLANQGKPNEALACFDKALLLNPNYEWPFTGKGWVFQRENDYEAAIEFYDKALRINPNFTVALDNKKICIDILNRRQSGYLDHLDEPSRLLMIGNSLFSHKRYQEAIEYFKRVLEIDPMNVSAEMDLNDAQDAIGYNVSSTVLQPNLNVSTIQPNQQVSICRSCGKKMMVEDKFCSGCGQPLKTNQTSTGTTSTGTKAGESSSPTVLDQANKLNIQGNEINKTGKYEEAMEYFDKALAINPNHVEALTNKGFALYRLGKNDEALSCYDKALAINPDNASTLNKKGNVLQTLGRFEEAMKCYDKALALNPIHSNPSKQ